MKFLIFIVSINAACVLAISQNKLEPSKLNMQQVEQLLQQIEKDEAKLKPVAQDDLSVSDALSKLFTQFRQLTSAYVDVLNAVNKNLGLPKYPQLPGLSRHRRSIMETTPFKQIFENINQLGTSIQEVGQLVSRTVSNLSEDSRRTVLKQFRQFTELWSNQINEISHMFDPNMMMLNNELQGRDEESVFAQINRHLSQLGRDIQRYVDNLLSDIRNRVVGSTRPPYWPRTSTN